MFFKHAILSVILDMNNGFQNLLVIGKFHEEPFSLTDTQLKDYFITTLPSQLDKNIILHVQLLSTITETNYNNLVHHAQTSHLYFDFIIDVKHHGIPLNIDVNYFSLLQEHKPNYSFDNINYQRYFYYAKKVLESLIKNRLNIDAIVSNLNVEYNNYDTDLYNVEVSFDINYINNIYHVFGDFTMQHNDEDDTRKLESDIEVDNLHALQTLSSTYNLTDELYEMIEHIAL